MKSAMFRILSLRSAIHIVPAERRGVAYPLSILFFLLLFLVSTVHAQENVDETVMFRQAVEQDRPILLIFSGSDWCAPCIRFDREVLSDTTVRKFVEEHLLVIRADFPQRKSLPDDLVERNERLAERYNADGEFPRVLLLNPDQSVLALLSHSGASPSSFLDEVQRYLPSPSPLREFRTSARLMGSGFEFTIVAADSLRASRLLQRSVAEVGRIERLLSEWIDTSQTSRLNRMAGKGDVEVDPELYALLQRSLAIYRLTQGAFDVSFGGVGNLWKFDGTQRTLPDSEAVARAVVNVGFENILMLDSFRVVLKKEGMRIGFGSIGKGYAADRVQKMLMDEGIVGGVINASGDLRAWGSRADGSPWRVGIADPKDRARMLLWLPITDGSVATSGNYEKFFEVDGIRYSHIIDPRTGWPARGVRSVTVISPSAELSDALATGIFVLGVEVGLDLVEQLPDVECIIVDDENRIHATSDLDIHTDAIGQLRGGR